MFQFTRNFNLFIESERDIVKNDILTNKFAILEGGITTPRGFTAGGIHCGIKRSRPDLAWCLSQVPATAAGVYTKNLFKAAPLLVSQASIDVEQKLQGVLVNSGVANACTGKQGVEDAFEMRRLLADRLQLPHHYIAVASTGVIGPRLPLDLIAKGVDQISDWDTSKASDKFEQAIMTTDLVAKRVCVELEIDNKLITIGGAAKGSGMINPNMATMLAFIATDADVDQPSLQKLLVQATNETFNMIAVDGDTSTNDMVLALANGLAGNSRLTPNHRQWDQFVAAFSYVARELAKKIARDGEGATKLIEVVISGAIDVMQARKIGKTIILSNLVKTAIFGGDPNWGRIVCAVGYSEQPINPESVNISLGSIPVFDQGMPIPFDSKAATDYLNQATVVINIDLGLGNAEATAWGCDLTYDYVRINAEYST